MKRVLTIFSVVSCLFASSVYADDPDWNKYSGAKAILDNIKQTAEKAFSL